MAQRRDVLREEPWNLQTGYSQLFRLPTSLMEAHERQLANCSDEFLDCAECPAQRKEACIKDWCREFTLTKSEAQLIERKHRLQLALISPE